MRALPGEVSVIKKTDVHFPCDDETNLGGWLYLPESAPFPHPAISMAHGFAGIKEHGLDAFAAVFAEAGFVVMVHDHRGFGSSGGLPRHDIDPWRQINDWRAALSYLESRPEVDRDRIGVWGTSYSGGHVLVLGATDGRIKCVVSQVPTISGYEQSRRRVPPESRAVFDARLLDDLRAQHRGERPGMQAVASALEEEPAAYRTSDAVDFYLQPLAENVWSNAITLRSTFAAGMYEPGIWVSRVAPTPLMMIVASHDTVTPTDLALQAYETALQPKSLEIVQGGHFDPYVTKFAQASGAAIAWFTQHLVL